MRENKSEDENGTGGARDCGGGADPAASAGVGSSASGEFRGGAVRPVVVKQLGEEFFVTVAPVIHGMRALRAMRGEERPARG